MDRAAHGHPQVTGDRVSLADLRRVGREQDFSFCGPHFEGDDLLSQGRAFEKTSQLADVALTQKALKRCSNDVSVRSQTGSARAVTSSNRPSCR